MTHYVEELTTSSISQTHGGRTRLVQDWHSNLYSDSWSFLCTNLLTQPVFPNKQYIFIRIEMHVHWVLCFSLLSLHPASAYHVTRQSSSRSSNRLLSRTALRPGYYSNSCTRELNRLSTALPALKVPLIQPTGANWWIWSLLAGASSLGIVLENTKIGAMLSSPLVTMGISLILCNIGILPTSSPVYSTVLKVSFSSFQAGTAVHEYF